MLELLTSPAAWASFLTLTVLEIVLGVDNVIFLSIAASRVAPEQRRTARFFGLCGALVLRVLLLSSIAWIITLSQPFVTVEGFGVSWRDLIMLGGGAFLIFKATSEIFAEVEGDEDPEHPQGPASLASTIFQIMILDLVFSLDSVITAVGIGSHLEVMIAAVIVAVGIMMLAAEPIGGFIEEHPSTKMLALAFLVMVGMALVADGLHYHIERGFIYAAMVFAGGVEGLNLLRQKRRREARARR